MKKVSLYLLILLSLIIITECSKTRNESIFECYDLNGDGHSESGTRGAVIDYAQAKTGGMTCRAATDRKIK